MQNDNELISYALDLWANYIETGNVAMSRNDAIERGDVKHIQKLTNEQVELVLKLRKLSINHLF